MTVVLQVIISLLWILETEALGDLFALIKWVG